MTETQLKSLLRELEELPSESAFRKLYHLCYDRFFRIAFYYVKNESWSQEVVLDVFVILWERRRSLKQILNFEDYCFILVKNTSLNFLAKEKRHSSHFADTEVAEANSNSYSPEETYITEELFALYVKALDRLPERCREVFIRVREEQQSYAQVAEAMQISTKTVDAQLQKAISRLKETINIYLTRNE